MSLHYLVKYECQKTGGNLKSVLLLMINHKVAEPSIKVLMGYFIKSLSFNLTVKEFLKSVNIWRSYGQKWLIASYAPIALHFCRWLD